jgi:type I restriction enzyme R subunit
MQTNFEFIKHNWEEIFNVALEAEKSVITAPKTSAFYSRFTLEQVVYWLYENDKDLKMPYETTLSAMIHDQRFKKNLAQGLFNRIYYIRKLGNTAVHSNIHIKPYESMISLKHLHAFLTWFANKYSMSPIQVKAFDESLIPQSDEKEQTANQLKELQQSLSIERDAHIKTKEEIETLRNEISQIKSQNNERVTQINFSDPSEAETRKSFIDILLREAGWDPNGINVAEYEVTGMPNEKGVGYVDYVLWGNDGLPLAVVEAKRTSENVEKGRRQAELYSNSLESMKGQRPIIFYTNGYDIWLWDDKMYPPRQVQGFYTKDQLNLLVQRRNTRKDLSIAQINKGIVGRYYQEEAIKRVTEDFSKGYRKTLLVMATGTGKTRVSIALVELLMKNNWVKNVLFLADRTALLKQAKKRFNEFLPQTSTVNIIEEKEDNTSRIVFSTYPTMMNSIDDAKNDGQKRFSVGHFDLIIIDEAHRSIYLKYQSIFDYFDAALVGLTATPKADVDKNTYQLFDLPDDNPTYAYELKQAIEDKFLVPPKEAPVTMKFLRKGLKYDELGDEDKLEYAAKFGDPDTGELPDQIDPPDFNDWVFNIDTVDKVLSHLMEKGIKVNEGDTIGKTIIFAKNHNHAEFIKERFDKNYPQYKGKFLTVIDNKIKYADTLIDEFVETNNIKIAVSVDMLDTGIDVPDVVNLVFFKIIRSKTKFWQMIGRGTRTCENLFGPGKDKECFTIFDFCGNLEFFETYPEGYKGSTQLPLNQQIFKQKLFLVQALQSADYQNNEDTKKLYVSLIDTMYKDISSIDSNSFQIRLHKRYVDKFQDRARWDNLTQGDIGEIIEHLIQFTTILNDDNEYARLFDLLILRYQLDLIDPTKKQERYQSKIIQTAALLERKANIPIVNKHIELIKKVQDETFWRGISINELENIRTALRELLQFLDRDQKKTVFTDFKDAIEELESPVINIGSTPTILTSYKVRVERLIRENSDDPIIQKIRQGVQLTNEDIEELEEILYKDLSEEEKETYLQMFKDKGSLTLLIRQVVGLDPNAAKTAFAKFLEGRNLNADQISFINSIIDYVVTKGLLNLNELYEQPFTNINSGGLDGVFSEKDSIKIISIIRDINNSARYQYA